VLEPKAKVAAVVPRRNSTKTPLLRLRLEMTPPLLWNRPLARKKKMIALTSRLSVARTLSKPF
jgi:hypothetical protein